MRYATRDGSTAYGERVSVLYHHLLLFLTQRSTLSSTIPSQIHAAEITVAFWEVLPSTHGLYSLSCSRGSRGFSRTGDGHNHRQGGTFARARQPTTAPVADRQIRVVAGSTKKKSSSGEGGRPIWVACALRRLHNPPGCAGARVAAKSARVVARGSCSPASVLRRSASGCCSACRGPCP